MTDKEIIEEQRRTIVALNSLIGGEGSTTTENLTLVSRLQQQIKELEEYKFMYESVSK